MKKHLGLIICISIALISIFVFLYGCARETLTIPEGKGGETQNIDIESIFVV